MTKSLSWYSCTTCRRGPQYPHSSYANDNLHFRYYTRVELPYGGWDKMAAILQETFSNSFVCVCLFENCVCLKIHTCTRKMFLNVQFTISQHWFRTSEKGLVPKRQQDIIWTNVYWHMYAALDLNEITNLVKCRSWTWDAYASAPSHRLTKWWFKCIIIGDIEGVVAVDDDNKTHKSILMTWDKTIEPMYWS